MKYTLTNHQENPVHLQSLMKHTLTNHSENTAHLQSVMKYTQQII